MSWPRLGTIAVLAVAVGLLADSQIDAKKPSGNGNNDPHSVQLMDNSADGYVCPTLKSRGLTQFSQPLAGGSLEAGDFVQIDLAGMTLRNCMWTVHKKGGLVNGVTFFFTTGGNGIHRTDKLPATANGLTIEIRQDCVDVWKEKGADKGTVAGRISVDDIVYVPV